MSAFKRFFIFMLLIVASIFSMEVYAQTSSDSSTMITGPQSSQSLPTQELMTKIAYIEKQQLLMGAQVKKMQAQVDLNTRDSRNIQNQIKTIAIVMRKRRAHIMLNDTEIKKLKAAISNLTIKLQQKK